MISVLSCKEEKIQVPRYALIKKQGLKMADSRGYRKSD
jgi:hypothetical protein